MFAELPTDATGFSKQIIAESLDALAAPPLTDNFDQDRFNHDGLDHSTEFNARERGFYFHWFFRSRARLFEAYQRLDDTCSRRLFLHLIAFRLAGHRAVRIPVTFDRDPVRYAAYKAAERNVESTLPYPGMFGKLRHFDFMHDGRRYRADCGGLGGFEYYLFRGQYFFDREGLRIAPEAGDHVIDAGACTGDTALVFSHAVGAAGCVYAFDPVAEHVAILEHNRVQAPLDNIRIMPFGLSDRDVNADLMRLDRYFPGFRVTDDATPLRSLDRLVAEGAIERVDFIKMDIEGSEMAALAGAVETIGRFRPKLAISLYHKPDDLFEIIQFIADKFPFYTQRLDHYTIHAEETVLYCVAPKGKT